MSALGTLNSHFGGVCRVPERSWSFWSQIPAVLRLDLDQTGGCQFRQLPCKASRMRLLRAAVRKGELPGYLNQGRTTMKLTTVALASVFALSSTLALATTSHHKHKSGARTHTAGQSTNYSRSSRAYDQYQYYGNPNNRGGLVGGADSGTYGQNRYYGNPNNRGGMGGGAYPGTYGQYQYYGNPNNRGGLVGGDDSGTR
jgi:hypothetical protein